MVILFFIYEKYGFVKIKFQKLLVFEKYEKKVFFERLGLSGKPDCRGNRIFFSGFFPKIELSTSLCLKNRNFDYGHLTCFEAYSNVINAFLMIITLL